LLRFARNDNEKQPDANKTSAYRLRIASN